jgi:hypothetical protein
MRIRPERIGLQIPAENRNCARCNPSDPRAERLQGEAGPSRPVLFRTVRMERNAQRWNVAAAKLQQDDSWTDGLAEVEN